MPATIGIVGYIGCRHLIEPHRGRRTAARHFGYVSGNRNMYTVVAWQRQKNLVWNIYCSAQRGDSAAWDPAVQLTNDSISCTNARVVAYNDSVFILSWKRRNAVLLEFLTHSPSSSPLRVSTPDTLAVSNDDSLDYDITLNGLNGYVVWTAGDTSGCRILLLRQINTYPIFALAAPDTLPIKGNISNPQSIGGYGYSSSYFGTNWQSIISTRFISGMASQMQISRRILFLTAETRVLLYRPK